MLNDWPYPAGPATVWSYTTDEFGQQTYGTPYLIPATDWMHGGEVARDDAGDEFVPRLTVFFEAEDGSSVIPERNWYILPGDHSSESSPPNNAERVRSVMQWPAGKIGGLPCWRVVA
jgi:hypothetical protein